jgi:hypothetical protein
MLHAQKLCHVTYGADDVADATIQEKVLRSPTASTVTEALHNGNRRTLLRYA